MWGLKGTWKRSLDQALHHMRLIRSRRSWKALSICLSLIHMWKQDRQNQIWVIIYQTMTTHLTRLIIKKTRVIKSNSEGKVSLVCLDTKQNKSNQKSWKKTIANLEWKRPMEKKKTVKKSPMKNILKTKNWKFCALLVNPRMNLPNLGKRMNIDCLANMLHRRWGS